MKEYGNKATGDSSDRRDWPDRISSRVKQLLGKPLEGRPKYPHGKRGQFFRARGRIGS